MKKTKKVILFTLVLVQLLFPSIVPSASAQQEKPVIILTSFFPVYAMVKNLTVDVQGIEVYNVAQMEGGCLHDYQLATEDMKLMAKGSILCINGGGMESFLGLIADQFPALTTIDASPNIELIFDEEHTHIDHEEHGESEEESHEGHEHLINAHFWLDVKNTITMVENLSKGLQGSIPLQAEKINKNELAYVKRLTVLDEELKRGFENIAKNDIITFHEAFPYFAKAYGFNIVSVIAKEPDEGLTPKELTDLIKTINEHPGIPLFVEPQYPSLAAETAAKETGSPIYTLDPLVSGNEENVLTYYEEGMRQNMKALLTAMENWK